MTSVTPSPARHYPLNDELTLLQDATGNTSNLLTNVDSVTIAYDSEFGNVASFGGVGYLLMELADVPPDVYGLDTNWSYCFWAKNNDTSTKTEFFSIGVNSTNSRITANVGSTLFLGYSGNNSIGSEVVEVNLVNDTWYHYCFVRAGNNFKFYVDGVLIIDDTTSQINPTETSFKIGNNHDLNTPWNGYMTDARMYTQSLTADQVVYLFGVPTPGYEVDTTELAEFEGHGVQGELNDSVVAVGNVTAKSLTLVAEKSTSGETEAASFVYMHDPATSERICISENLHTVNTDDTQSTSTLKLCNTNSVGDRVSQKCVQYSGDSVDIHSVSSVGAQSASTIDFDGLSFDSDEAAVVLGPLLEFRIKYDAVTDTLQIQRLQDGVYATKVEYGR